MLKVQTKFVDDLEIAKDPFLGDGYIDEKPDWIECPPEAEILFKQEEEKLRGPLTIKDKAQEFYWKLVRIGFPCYYNRKMAEHAGRRILGHAGSFGSGPGTNVPEQAEKAWVKWSYGKDDKLV